jgi:hypothetical protein
LTALYGAPYVNYVEENLVSNTEPLSPVKRKRGRPRKEEILAKKARGVVGRPPGEAARIKEFYARLLSTSGEKVIETVLRKAMDDQDKDQVACLKMCMDRLLPVSHFEKQSQGRSNAIQVQIVTTGTPQISAVEPEQIDYEVIDVDTDEEPNNG